MLPFATRIRSLGTDSRGRYRLDLGKRQTESGKLIQPRFLLGRDQAQAEHRAALLRRVWNAIEASGGTTWDAVTLFVASEVAKGSTRIELPASGVVHDHIDADALFVTHTINRFPFLPIIPPSAEGVKKNAAFLDFDGMRTEAARIGLLSKRDADNTASGSLHEAFDAYLKSIDDEGIRHESGLLKESQERRKGRIGRFKNAREDVPLSGFNRDAFAAVLAHWRNRPTTKLGKRCSYDNSRHHITELYRFPVRPDRRCRRPPRVRRIRHPPPRARYGHGCPPPGEI